MTRREFITLLGGAAPAWPLAARAAAGHAGSPALSAVCLPVRLSAKPPRFLKGSVKRVISKAKMWLWLNGQYDQLPITYG